MKKTLLTGLAMSVAVMCQASLPKVSSVEKVTLPEGMTVSMATISPDGSYAVVSPLSGVGLQRLDLNNGSLTEISKTGLPMSLMISNDGSTVVYREATVDKNHRRYVSVKSYNNVDGKTSTLVTPTRNLNGVMIDGNQTIAVENGRKMTRSLKGVTSQPSNRVALSINYGKLYVTEADGTTREIRPLGNQCGSYLWPTLSPDGKSIVAFGVGNGTFVCDLDGNNVKLLGMYRAPQWLDNETVVAMEDFDNGIETVKSTVMAISADGKEKAKLTNDDVVALFPTAGGGKVAFNTPAGELYIINLK